MAKLEAYWFYTTQKHSVLWRWFWECQQQYKEEKQCNAESLTLLKKMDLLVG